MAQLCPSQLVPSLNQAYDNDYKSDLYNSPRHSPIALALPRDFTHNMAMVYTWGGGGCLGAQAPALYNWILSFVGALSLDYQIT